LSKHEIIKGFNFYNPVNVHFGLDSYAEQIKALIPGKYRKVALFYGKESLEKAGVIKKIKKLLKSCQIVEYGGIDSNPLLEAVSEAVNNAKTDIEVVLAIGGGSVLDFAKSFAFLLPQNKDIQEFLTGDSISAKAGLPFIAIPTTSGTGSEVTPWASLWQAGKGKFSLTHQQMFPEHAIIDPALGSSLCKRITAYTAFDALSHAFEALWAKSANPVSDMFALKAVELFMTSFENLISDLQNLSLRKSISEASYFAGLAFSNTKTAAVHAVSYPLTWLFNLPHGAACGLLLGDFFLFNEKEMSVAKVSALLEIAGVSTTRQLREKLRLYLHIGGLPVSLRQAGIAAKNLEQIVAGGFSPQRMANNPRQVTPDDLRGILENLY